MGYSHLKCERRLRSGPGFFDVRQGPSHNHPESCAGVVVCSACSHLNLWRLHPKFPTHSKPKTAQETVCSELLLSLGCLAALMLGVALWYVARPKPWDTASIVAAHPPGFNVSEDGKSVSFHYQLENRTSTDYTITTADQIKFTMRLRNGTLLPPFPALDKVLLLPLEIPAKQKAELFFQLPASNLPVRSAAETDAAYHERLRGYCNEHYRNAGGFVLFDDSHHYQIDLPRWRDTPKKP